MLLLKHLFTLRINLARSYYLPYMLLFVFFLKEEHERVDQNI